LKAFIIFVLVLVGVVAAMLFYVSKMPGASPSAAGGITTEEEKSAADRMHAFCEEIAHVIGHRSTAKPMNTVAAREVIKRRLGSYALKSKESSFTVRTQGGVNVEAEIEGGTMKNEIVVLGAHYDTDAYDPGADDDASGCSMLLELAGRLKGQSHDRTIVVAFFDYGSSRFAGTKECGSWAWAEDAARAGKKIAAMVSLDSIGRFKDDPGSQSGPFLLSSCYPSQGNFLLVESDLGARDFVKSAVTTLRTAGMFPTEGLTVPGFLPWFEVSDHIAFRKHDWPAIVITDTGPYRNPEHGTPSDTPDRLQYDRMAKALTAIEKLVDQLARAGGTSTSLN
jgi:Zn-dependent M28 family amino/carboxypeptidase